MITKTLLQLFEFRMNSLENRVENCECSDDYRGIIDSFSGLCEMMYVELERVYKDSLKK
jgi:hypothetical protein